MNTAQAEHFAARTGRAPKFYAVVARRLGHRFTETFHTWALDRPHAIETVAKRLVTGEHYNIENAFEIHR